jgi:LIVCS family branched-chain amino acid:cation transporter
MKNENILTIGKFFFWLSFTLGNIYLFGYLISQNECFAFYGFMLLIFGSIINLLVVIGLMIYGVIIKSQLNVCMKASIIICINIPIAILYYFIGISLLNF